MKNEKLEEFSVLSDHTLGGSLHGSPMFHPSYPIVRTYWWWIESAIKALTEYTIDPLGSESSGEASLVYYFRKYLEGYKADYEYLTDILPHCVSEYIFVKKRH